MAPQRPVIDPRQLMAVASVEAAVIASVLLRFGMQPGTVNLTRLPHLVWLVGCLLFGAAGAVFFVLRSAALLRGEARGENVDGERRRTLVLSIALMVPGLALSLAGP